MKRYAILMAAAVMAAAGTTWAQNAHPAATPDQAPKAAPVVVPPGGPGVTPGANQPKPAPTVVPPGGELVSPDAANAVDTEDLIKKLTGQAKDDADPEKLLDEMMEKMTASAQRLHDKDPGALTQETQRRIVMNLDSLIELVRQQQQQQQQQPGKPKPGEEKQKNDPGKPQPSNQEGGNNAAQQEAMRSGNAKEFQGNGTNMTERGKEWRNLPDRDRDLIANSAKEDALPTYKEIVQRYYQALAEVGKTGTDK